MPERSPEFLCKLIVLADQTIPLFVRLFRLAKILSIASRYGLDEMILEQEPSGRLAACSRALHFWRRFDAPPAVRLRQALESLGPIFVKFGQVLSTRRDLLRADDHHRSEVEVAVVPLPFDHGREVFV
jgi:predicted unusual protein kinase regulating ubiquinone biosynthesis (AarF/ABC1/UbiB family)